MEYLLNEEQSESAAQLLGEGLTPAELEEDIENLRVAFYRVQFGEDAGDVDLVALSRRAYLLATLVADAQASYEPQLVGKAMSVAAVIFEYLSQLDSSAEECLKYALNAILFYSKGEQEAQSATLAQRLLREGSMIESAFDGDTQESWRMLLLFLGRDFRGFLRWGRDSSEDFFSRLVTSTEDAPYWVELLSGCLDAAKSMVWSSRLPSEDHFNSAVIQARAWGDTRLTWLGLTVKEVVEEMSNRSLRKRLTEIGIPGWASETLTMDSIVEMWLPHREALAIWVVPSRALVFDIQSRLRTRLRRIGIEVSSLPGGIEADPLDTGVLSSARVFVLTPEKLDGLLRRSPTVMDSMRIIVVDEMQKIGEAGRGWLFETVIAWLLLYAEQNQNLRLLFMSAVLPNRPDFEVWLGEPNDIFVSRWATWRPTRLALLATTGTGFRPWTTTLIQKHSQEIIATHTEIRRPRIYDVPITLLHILRSQRGATLGSTLVFFYTKDDVDRFVTRLSQEIPEQSPIPEEWLALSDKFESVYGHDHRFPLALKRGVGIDHADIPLWLRHMVERAFRRGDLPTLVANQAILEGVNFPIEDLIIGSLGSGLGQYFRFRLSAQGFVNLIGRVGRAMVDTEGRCFLVWNWFYEGAANDNLSWDVYSTPVGRIEDIRSWLTTNETELIQALSQLASSLEGVDESVFDTLGVWRDRLERLHSSALALLELPETVDYSRLSRWIEKTLAWQQLGNLAKETLRHYIESEWRGFQRANRPLYRLASLSGLSVRSANEVQNVAREIIGKWVEDTEPTFETVFTPERFNTIVGLRECWRQRPVTYGTKGYLPRVDHHAAAVAWINGETWTQVADIICANHQNLQERTRSGIVAAYVSQMFEYRLPWVLGGVAVAAKELGGPEELCNFLEAIPSRVRYGVSTTEAVAISKLCGAERAVVLVLTQKFLEEATEQRDFKRWIQQCSLSKLREWLPDEPQTLLKDLYMTLHGVRERDWTLRRGLRPITGGNSI